MTVPSFEDLFAAFERGVVLADGPIDITAVRTDGSTINLIALGAATMGQEVALYGQNEYAAMHFSTAVKRGGEVLERWVYDRYGLRKRSAQSAIVPLQFSRQGTDGFTIGAGSLVSTAEGVVFETVNDLPVPPNVLGPFGVNAVAQQTGIGGNVAAGTIVEVVTPFQTDTTLTVTNVEPAAGGTEDETDIELAARAESFFISAQRGTQSAVLAAVLNVPGVSSAFVSELLDGNGNPAGIGSAVIADSSGGGNTALAQRVVVALREFRGLGVPVEVSPGIPVFVDIEVSNLAFLAGFDSTEVLGEARQRVVAAVNVLSPGQLLEQASIYSALKQTPGLVVSSNSIDEPAGDIVPLVSEALRTTGDRVVLNGTTGSA